MNKEQKLNEESKKMKALAGIQEGNKKFLTNESFSEEKNKIENETPKIMNNDSNIESGNIHFTIIKFDQIDVEPNDDDEKLYNLK